MVDRKNKLELLSYHNKRGENNDKFKSLFDQMKELMQNDGNSNHSKLDQLIKICINILLKKD